MARLLGPDMGSRMVVQSSGARAAQMDGTVYANSTGTVLADILAYQSGNPTVPGATLAGSRVTTDSYGLLPLFWFPDGIDVVWITVNSGPLVPINADYDARMDALGTRVTAVETVDAATGVGSLRTLGTGALQATAGSDARLTNARTPTVHAATHDAGGVDPMAVDALPAVASLRTLGAGAQQAAVGADAIRRQAVDIKGDLIVGSGNDTVARLGPGADGMVLMTEAALALGLKWISVSPDVQVFVTPGTFTWTKPVGAKLVQAIVVSGGGGGGSGRRGAAATVRCGGGGGGGGGWADLTMEASQLPATVPVLVGIGGAGGAGRVVDNSDGISGSSGGISAFGSSVSAGTDELRIRPGQGGGGGAGTVATGTSGPAAFAMFSGQGGGAANTAGGVGANGGDTGGGAPGGGAGGGISATDVVAGGGQGGVNGILDQNRAAAGTVAGAAGTAGRNALTRTSGPGNGGGGGAASITGAGGNGGVGGFTGAGGGGGGASLNGFASGAGGAGGAGIVVVITYF